MDVRMVVSRALVLTVAAAGIAQGMDPHGVPPVSAPQRTAAAEPALPTSELAPPPTPTRPHASRPSTELVPPPTPTYHNPSRGISPWITYTQPDCCGPLGGQGLVQTELYVRPGASFVVGGGIFRDRLDTGYAVQAGGRSLIFDPAEIRAWTLDFSITNIWSNGQGDQTPFLFDLVPVTVRDLNRTFVNVGLGREYYLVGSARSCEPHWRAGWDAGMHYGTSRMGLNDPSRPPDSFRRVTSWEWGPWAAVHADYEIQHGSVSFLTGLRLEWNMNFMNRLTDFNNDLTNLNLLWNLAVRY